MNKARMVTFSPLGCSAGCSVPGAGAAGAQADRMSPRAIIKIHNLFIFVISLFCEFLLFIETGATFSLIRAGDNAWYLIQGQFLSPANRSALKP
jgi:hypothetical protein